MSHRSLPLTTRFGDSISTGFGPSTGTISVKCSSSGRRGGLLPGLQSLQENVHVGVIYRDIGLVDYLPVATLAEL